MLNIKTYLANQNQTWLFRNRTIGGKKGIELHERLKILKHSQSNYMVELLSKTAVWTPKIRWD